MEEAPARVPFPPALGADGELLPHRRDLQQLTRGPGQRPRGHTSRVPWPVRGGKSRSRRPPIQSPMAAEPVPAARPFAQRMRIALAEKGLAYETVEEDLAAKSDLLLCSNSAHGGKVPVLLHVGRPICDSLVILEYLDEAFPSTPPLLPPSDPYARARARFWAEYSGWAHVCGKRLWIRRNSGEVDEPPEHEAREEMLAVLRTLDGELGGREFFGEDAFGFVDVAAALFAPWSLTYEWHGRFIVAEEFPVLAAWAERCARRDSVRENVHAPEKVYQLILEYREWLLGLK